MAAFDLNRFRRLVTGAGDRAPGDRRLPACPDTCGPSSSTSPAHPRPGDRRASPVADRIELTAGDFFVDVLPEADLYALGRILHDWTESKILHLLRRIFDRLPTGGGLLIAEKLLDDDKRGPRWAQMQNLNMLTCTEGKERTLSEYEALLEQAGFSQVTAAKTPSPLDAVLAVKA